MLEAMTRGVSSFVAGLLVGVALTSGIAAAVLRFSSAGSSEASPVVAREASVQLRLAHGLTRDHPVHRGLERFAELVAERTDGRITVQLFPNGELGSETATLEQLQAGTLDLAKASAAPLGSFDPGFAVFSVPYAFRDRDHYWAVLDGAIGTELLEGLGERGLRGLAYLDAGARSFYSVERPILGPTDLVGKKVRVMQSETAMDMVSAFGGSPTPMAYAELYSSLQSGLVDAAENNPPSYFASRHYEVARHFTLNEHTRVPDVLLASRRTWNRLAPTDRDTLIAAAREASRYQRQLWAESSEGAIQQLVERGVQIHVVDAEPFADAVEDLRRSYAGSRVGELLDRIARVGGEG